MDKSVQHLWTKMDNYMWTRTSTAESVENIDLELAEGANMYTHVWFDGVAYDRDILESDHRH